MCAAGLLLVVVIQTRSRFDLFFFKEKKMRKHQLLYQTSCDFPYRPMVQYAVVECVRILKDSAMKDWSSQTVSKEKKKGATGKVKKNT